MIDKGTNIKKEKLEEKRRKDERLAEQLRANLRRRKSQSRARKETQPTEESK